MRICRAGKLCTNTDGSPFSDLFRKGMAIGRDMQIPPLRPSIGYGVYALGDDPAPAVPAPTVVVVTPPTPQPLFGISRQTLVYLGIALVLCKVLL